jgi:hypothetical protein
MKLEVELVCLASFPDISVQEIFASQPEDSESKSDSKTIVTQPETSLEVISVFELIGDKSP